MTLSVTQIIYYKIIEWLVNVELERVWKEAAWPDLRKYPIICMKGLRNHMETSDRVVWAEM
jgi:hypothetical protein